MDLLVSSPVGKYSFRLADNALLVNHGGVPTHSCLFSDPRPALVVPPLTIQHHYVLESHYDNDNDLFHVSYLINKLDKKKGISLELIKVTGTVQDKVQAFEWAEKLMSTVYDGEVVSSFPIEFCLMMSIDHGIQRSRRLRVLVNPNGGVVRLLPHYLTAAIFTHLPT